MVKIIKSERWLRSLKESMIKLSAMVETYPEHPVSAFTKVSQTQPHLATRRPGFGTQAVWIHA